MRICKGKNDSLNQFKNTNEYSIKNNPYLNSIVCCSFLLCGFWSNLARFRVSFSSIAFSLLSPVYPGFQKRKAMELKLNVIALKRYKTTSSWCRLQRRKSLQELGVPVDLLVPSFVLTRTNTYVFVKARPPYHVRVFAIGHFELKQLMIDEDD